MATMKVKKESGGKTVPDMLDLIKECILEHPWESQGVSRVVIKKYILQTYGVAPDADMAKKIGIALRDGLAKGVFDLPSGLNGKVKLVLTKNVDGTNEKKPTAEQRTPLAATGNVPRIKVETKPDVMTAKHGVKPRVSPKKLLVQATLDKENGFPVVKALRKQAAKDSPLRPRAQNVPRDAAAELKLKPHFLKPKAEASPKDEIIEVKVKPKLPKQSPAKPSAKENSPPQTASQFKPRPHFLPKQHVVHAKPTAKTPKKAGTKHAAAKENTSPLRLPTKSPAKIKLTSRPYVPKDPSVSIIKWRRDLGKAPAPTAGTVVVSGTSKWMLNYRMGGGAFGDVWHAKGFGTNAGEVIAVKVEWNKAQIPLLELENTVYCGMKDIVGIPERKFFVTHGEFLLLGMEMQGQSMEGRLRQWTGSGKGGIPLNEVLDFGIQMLTRLEHFHTRGWLHRDFKPDNVLRPQAEGGFYYLVDFGFSKRFQHPKTFEHIAPRNGKGPCGTPRYASLNVHKGREPSRRDDLEALAYCMIYLRNGSLPWQNVNAKDDIWDATYRIKAHLSIEHIAYCLPEVGKFLRYCRNLGFAEQPNYKMWRDTFRGAYTRLYPPNVFVWDQPVRPYGVVA